MGEKKLPTKFLLSKLEEIPSLPSIVYELSRIINDPMSSTTEVEEIMATDIGMTAKVLKLANSAYYAIPGGVSNLARAIAFIGFDTVHQLVLSASIIQSLETKTPSPFQVNEFWKHSIAVGIGAETIAKHIHHPSPGDLFTSGLVHDMGKIALLICQPDMLTEIVELCAKKNISFGEAEKELADMDHCEIGKILSEKWQLPKAIQVSAKFHHQMESQLRGGLSTELNTVVDIVALSNLFVHALKFGNSGHTKILGAPQELLSRLMIKNEGDVAQVVRNIKVNLDKASDFIAMIGGK